MGCPYLERTTTRSRYVVKKGSGGGSPDRLRGTLSTINGRFGRGVERTDTNSAVLKGFVALGSRFNLANVAAGNANSSSKETRMEVERICTTRTEYGKW